MSYKYINTEELRNNFLISEEKGYITPEFKLQLIQIIEDVMKKYNRTLSELDEKVLCWAALRDVCIFWINFNSKKYDNPFPYFIELTKRSIAKNYKRSDLRQQYYQEQRKEKLQKIENYTGI